jgi:predicted Zn finger-like uncharacterized protein
MYTQCTSCATLFRVTSRHLRHAHGLVRCCLCQEVFDALSCISDALPGTLAAPVPAPTLSRALSRDESMTSDLFMELPSSGDAEPAEAPVTARRRFGSAGWSAVALLLLVLVVAQYAYVMRDELARYPRLRPWIETICLAADCQLPLLRDVSRVHILYRQVDHHPTLSGGLLVKATLVNDAGYRQPFPQVRFTFLDPSGDERSSRWFSPDEYLRENALVADVLAGMPPQEPVSIRLQLADADPAAIDNFKIELR